MRNLLAAFLLGLTSVLHSAETPISGLAWPSLSPDGETLVFEWLNDLWLAPSNGGEAVRILKHPSREAYPRFTPDGKRLVFSSERSGSAQVYSIKIDGSDLQQHSYHTEGNVLEDISPDGSEAIVRGIRQNSGYKPTRLLRVDLTKESRETLLFDATAHSVSISPDGNRYLFCQGGEQLYRKGYHGSRAACVHLFDSEANSFTKVIGGEWETRSPLWQRNGNGFYYVSNRSGVFNVYEHKFESAKDAQLTFFEKSGVILPTLSANGKVMLFRAGQEVYRLKLEGGRNEPDLLHFYTNESVPARSSRKERVTGTSGVSFSKRADRIVFSAAGDLWTLEGGAETPIQLTQSDALDEREPVLGLKEEFLYFLRDNGLEMEICRAEWDDGKIGPAEIFWKSLSSMKSLRLSPDGSRLSWLESTGNLVTMPTVGGEAIIVHKGWDMPTYDWSPDGRWLAVAAKDVNSNRDIFLVSADGSIDSYNLTRHPAFEGSPKWSPDGKWISFTARRGPDELSRLWVAEVAAHLSGGASELDFDAISESIRPVPTDISEPTRSNWAPDSKAILFQSRDKDDETIYAIGPEDGKVTTYASFRGIPHHARIDGASLWRIDRIPAVFHDGELTKYPFSFSVTQNRSARLRLGFRKIWRTLAERFYDETMNQTDWESVLGNYEDAAAEARDSRQFDRVVAQLLGELNASHLTFNTNPWGVKVLSDKLKNPTAFPGMSFTNKKEGPLTIEKVLGGSPVAKLPDPPQPGDVVLRIGGKSVDAGSPLHTFFNGAKGRSIPVTIRAMDGEVRTFELMPISYETARFLDREEKVAAAKKAARRGDYRIAYLPFRKMKTDDLRELSTLVYRASIQAEGLVLDLRDNAGGRVADELLALFCQPEHTFTIPRGGPRGYPTDRRVSPAWNGPMVVLCNENTFSNAEIFCHAFKQLGRGKLIGRPTNGGVISAVSITIPEMGKLQIPFRGWFHSQTGRDLELNGAVPDIEVDFPPGAQQSGTDPQLQAALESLTETLRELPPIVSPVFKNDPR
ncbi:S41 family peptidase [Luteolibacter algae]|uniref:Tricorn protease homolog n=1 Tax=Luteolibacter algae TaxID=454151 RepID=A0ABW5DAJ3_9BACT